MKHRIRRRAVIAELKRHPWLRAADIAGTLGVSERTIQRDFTALRKQGIPVEGRKGKGTRLAEGFVLDPVALTSDEAALMVVGSTVVAEQLDKDMQLVARAARKRLMDVGASQLATDVAALEVKLRLAPGGMGEAAHEREALELLRQALISQTAIQFILENSTEPQTFYPYGLSRVGARWHAVGYCVLQGVVCNYLVDAMLSIVLQKETFTRPGGYAPDGTAVLKDAKVPVRVQFDAVSSQWIVAATPSFVTTIQKKDDGIVVTLGSAPEAQVFAWILGWGAHARVLSPVAVQRRVASEATAMAMLYEDTTDGRKRQPTLF